MARPQVIISGRCVRVISSVTKDGVEAIFGITLTLPEVKSLIERLSFAAVEIEQQEPAPTATGTGAGEAFSSIDIEEKNKKVEESCIEENPQNIQYSIREKIKQWSQQALFQKIKH